MSRFVHNINKFYQEAEGLRGLFDERFAEPRKLHGHRFVWDYWHIPGQYTFLRTPAWEYFPDELYVPFHEYLVRWGRETLGCWDISPTWLSIYIDGCEQLLHSDVPHGPWAFVYSLTPKRVQFRGGETMILRPEVLNYWPGFNGAVERERNSYVQLVPPRFNRLTVFDPRFPHGVTRVSGTHNPAEGRLVLHGWFTEPRPFITGPLKQEQIDEVLEPNLGQVAEIVSDTGPYLGLLSLRMTIDKSGEVSEVKSLANTLIRMEEPESSAQGVIRRIMKLLKGLTFPKKRSKTVMTLPLLFQ
jgi:hypothetical protein